MAKTGCQPFWLDFLQTDLPNCKEASQISCFLEDFWHLAAVETEKELMEKYSCLKPCRYMEYKVWPIVKINLILFNFTVFR